MGVAVKPNALPWLALSVLVIALDQWSKAWVLSSLVLAHLPFNFQRRMLGGIQLPLAVLAMAALSYVVVPAAARG